MDKITKIQSINPGIFSKRRINEYDVIKASTKQKEGKKVPKGPNNQNFNEFIEKELTNYKETIEFNFQKSTLKQFRFPR
jgi:hypothetical protein